MRTREALSSLSFGLVPTLALGTAFVAHVKLTHDAHTWVRMALLGATLVAAALTVGVVVRAYARRYAPHVGALLVDKTHGLSDRLTNALAFAALPDESRTPLMEAAIEDALAHAPQVSATRAVPLSVPRDFAAAAAIGVLLLGLSTLQWSRRELLPIAATIDAVGLSPDDVDLFRDTLRELQKKDQSPETQQALQQFNQLIEDIADKRIDRNEAFKRMEEIERKLAKGQAAEAKALEEALKQMAAEMKKSSLSKPAGEALEKKDFKGAENALKELAKQLRDKQSKISEADKKRLKEALQAAVKKHKESLAKLSEAREQLRASLLQRQQKPEAQRTDEEKKLLQREQRELERLDKEIDQKERAERQLEKLDRELSQAAEDLMKDLGLTADDLDKGAEDLNRMGKEEMSEQEKEELRQRLRA